MLEWTPKGDTLHAKVSQVKLQIRCLDGKYALRIDVGICDAHRSTHDTEGEAREAAQAWLVGFAGYILEVALDA